MDAKTIVEGEPLPSLEVALEVAEVRTKGQRLIATTGKMERHWKWTGFGLSTISLRDQQGREWCSTKNHFSADYAFPDAGQAGEPAILVNLSAKVNDDEGFTQPHIQVQLEQLQKSSGLSLIYSIWIYPGAPGIRTQLFARGSERTKNIEIHKPGSSGSTPFLEPILNPDGKLEGWTIRQLESTTSYSLLFRSHPKLATELTSCPQSARFRSLDGESEQTVSPFQSKQNAQDYRVELPPEFSSTGSCRFFLAAPVTLDQLEFLQLQSQDQTVLAEWNASEPAPSSVESSEDMHPGRVDAIPAGRKGNFRHTAFGYYNNTQKRNNPDTPLLREETVDSERIEWANVYCIESGNAGLMMVKESHKCVNQPGVHTGAFIIDETGLSNTGWGLSIAELDTDRWRWCWASWVLLYDGTATGRQCAIKSFDRLRYPFDPVRDRVSYVCTWGHCLNARDGRDQARENNVLEELEHTQAIGVDMLLIDDGWAIDKSATHWKPDHSGGWKPSPDAYPNGWNPLIAKSRSLGMRLGLWAAAQDISLEEMMWNWKQLKMELLKLDFADLRSHTELDELVGKVRRFMLQSKKQCAISWDTTENDARYGYFWAREYGSVHLMNRKPRKPMSVVYIPWLALRDFWQLSRYLNLNKWALVIQNPEVVDPELSDAPDHSPDYCVATALMGIPEFMALPRHYSKAAKVSVRSLMDVYKRHRESITEAVVYPIGSEPSNTSWTGFMALNKPARKGYLTLFRERLNEASSHNFSLPVPLSRHRLEATDLLDGHRFPILPNQETNRSEITAHIPNAPGFRFLSFDL